ncbi:hypothetical protein [Persicobacter diffluens]|uniref:Uncharacterized protein n=1 Tax=Persicobacter diffluens TaxID=981 RepID=A0AAN5AM93_9BACT|nr:hypothetical protein PEDI_53770 [Persicobacter diffluens]
MKKLAFLFALSVLIFSCDSEKSDPINENQKAKYEFAFSFTTTEYPPQFNENMEIEVTSGVFSYISIENGKSVTFENRKAPFTVPFQDHKTLLLYSSEYSPNTLEFKINVPIPEMGISERNLRLGYSLLDLEKEDFLTIGEKQISPSEIPWNQAINF